MLKSSPFILGTVALALVVSGGCSKSSESSTSTAEASAAPAASAMAVAAKAPAAGGSAAGDAAHGKTIYTANCAGCHGATGTEGGAGPSLKGEKAKKNQAAAVAWIKNPVAPMPKLYPSPLSAKDVNDVAAFVETL